MSSRLISTPNDGCGEGWLEGYKEGWLDGSELGYVDSCLDHGREMAWLLAMANVIHWTANDIHWM